MCVCVYIYIYKFIYIYRANPFIVVLILDSRASPRRPAPRRARRCSSRWQTTG